MIDVDKYIKEDGEFSVLLVSTADLFFRYGKKGSRAFSPSADEAGPT